MRRIYPYLCLAGAMVIVGSSVVAGKIMIAGFPVCLASLLRFALALVLLLPLMLLREGKWPALSRRSLGVLALQGLCGSFLFTVFTLGGLEYGSAADAGIITSATPACMGLLAWMFLNERLTARIVAAIVLSGLGIATLNLGQDAPVQASSSLPGNALFLAAVVVESIFLLLRKAVPEKLSPLAASTLVSVFGLIYFAPIGIYQALTFDFAAPPLSSWLSVAYAGVFVTVAAYLLWFAGIVRVSAQAAGTMTGIMPASAVTLAALVLGEPLSAGQMSGCALVLAGILLAAGGGKGEGERGEKGAREEKERESGEGTFCSQKVPSPEPPPSQKL